MSIFTSVSSLWSSNDNLNILASKDILNLSYSLQKCIHTIELDFPDFFQEEDKIKFPQIVVVGTQSSGKSSILNRLLCMDLLPTGEEMITRTPLQLTLIQSEENHHAIFLETNKKIELTMPIPKKEEIDKIREEIKRQTIEFAGDQKNLSKRPIYLRVSTPFVPNLELVDLPGLTMIACEDRGQPADIKEQIREIVTEYIINPQTIILCVMKARVDLETDMALDLVKSIDKEGQRTMGILTKVDLMNYNTDISNYLEQNTSQSLLLNYGYYALKNRSLVEKDKINVLMAAEQENKFFQSHEIYRNKKFSSLLGIGNVGRTISNILLGELRKKIPRIKNTIQRKLNTINIDLQQIGSLPSDDKDLQLLVHNLLSSVKTMYSDSIIGRNPPFPCGTKIKKCFAEFRQNLENCKPFTLNNISNQDLENIIEHCEGIHMSSICSAIDVIEHCFSSKTNDVFDIVGTYSHNCVSLIASILQETVASILSAKQFSRFPHLCSLITESFSEKEILLLQEPCRDKIKEFFDQERKFIWTENLEFIDRLNNARATSRIDTIRNLLQSYFDSIVCVAKHMIPKIIMYHIVLNSIEILSFVCITQSHSDNVKKLLKEPDDIHQQRKKLQVIRRHLTNAITLLS